MKHILSGEGEGVLARFARSRPLLALDFDGTLAPIVSDRDGACMRASTLELLALACQRFPTAIISGRGRADVEKRLAGAAVKHIVGNHGLEAAVCMPAFEEAVSQMRPSLSAELSPRGDVEIEDKRYSLAVHYRKSKTKRQARAAILNASSNLVRAPRIVLGKSVINLLPQGSPHKGNALQDLCAQEAAATAIYVGDDVTDEDVFSLNQPDRILAIRIGRSRSSSAPFFLRDQVELDAFLARLIALSFEEHAR